MEIEVTRIAPGHELLALFNWKWIGSFQLFFRSWVGFYSWVRELLGINRISIQMLFPFPHLVRTHCSSPEHCIGKPMKARRGWRLEKLKYFLRIYSQSFRQLSRLGAFCKAFVEATKLQRNLWYLHKSNCWWKFCFSNWDDLYKQFKII